MYEPVHFLLNHGSVAIAAAARATVCSTGHTPFICTYMTVHRITTMNPAVVWLVFADRSGQVRPRNPAPTPDRGLSLVQPDEDRACPLDPGHGSADDANRRPCPAQPPILSAALAVQMS
uniref:Uncharacterized protein n=1 Tax=Bionectria ochroleuca TaxID=29856 RepID=A0A8H7NEW4_BIOOC